MNVMLSLRSTAGSRSARFLYELAATTELARACNRLFILNHLRRQKGHSLLTVLNLTFGTKQRDVRDAVYSKIGLASDSRQVLPVLDYSKDARQLFIDLVLGYIKAKGSLDIFCSVRPETPGSQDHTDLLLPSWVPDWRLDKFEEHLISGVPISSTALQFCAGGKMKPAVRLLQSDVPEPVNEVLVVTGFVYDSIHPSCLQEDTTMMDDRSPDPVQMLAAFCRTLVANHFFVDNGQLAQPVPDATVLELVTLLKVQFRDEAFLNKFGSHLSSLSQVAGWLPQRLDNFGVLCMEGKTIRSWVHLCDHFLVEGVSWNRHLEQSVRRMKCSRRVAQGRLSRIYLVPEVCQADDLICLLSGCALPMVLRRSQGRYYKVIGPCYADGIMHGEAMREHLTHSTLDEFHLI